MEIDHVFKVFDPARRPARVSCRSRRISFCNSFPQRTRFQLRTRGPDRRWTCRLPNRPPCDEKRDRFLHHNNLDFKHARAYTLADLLDLPQQSVPVVEESGEIVFNGPSLQDVLAAAKPLNEAKTVRLSALDGYAAEIPLATVEFGRLGFGSRGGWQRVWDR